MQRYVEVVQQAQQLHAAGELHKAADLYEHLLGSQPDDPLVLYLYGTLHSQAKMYGSAMVMLRLAVESAPQLTEAWYNLGVCYRMEGHTEQARDAYRKVLAAEPNNAECLAMMAGSWCNEGAPEIALQWADKALALTPDDPHARNHKALALLEMGRWDEAWPYYSTRWQLPGISVAQRPYEAPLWDGEPVRLLAIHGEQGVGDEIMFLSCLEQLRGRFENIVIECEPRLQKLLQRTFDCPTYGTHDELIAAHPDVDAYIPMGGLAAMTRAGPECCPGQPYLKPDPEKVSGYRDWLHEQGDGPYVGICWHGGTKGTHQTLRNPPMEWWKELTAKQGTFVSLQYGSLGLDGAIELGLPHLQSAIDDLDDFAALTAALDVVISPCQTAVHFAGALGTECWCLTPNKPAWRYQLKGETMPWYDSVKLYRQGKGDWRRAFNKVLHDYDHDLLRRAESAAA